MPCRSGRGSVGRPPRQSPRETKGGSAAAGPGRDGGGGGGAGGTYRSPAETGRVTCVGGKKLANAVAAEPFYVGKLESKRFSAQSSEAVLCTWYFVLPVTFLVIWHAGYGMDCSQIQVL